MIIKQSQLKTHLNIHSQLQQILELPYQLNFGISNYKGPFPHLLRICKCYKHLLTSQKEWNWKRWRIKPRDMETTPLFPDAIKWSKTFSNPPKISESVPDPELLRTLTPNKSAWGATPTVLPAAVPPQWVPWPCPSVLAVTGPKAL